MQCFVDAVCIPVVATATLTVVLYSHVSHGLTCLSHFVMDF